MGKDNGLIMLSTCVQEISKKKYNIRQRTQNSFVLKFEESKSKKFPVIRTFPNLTHSTKNFNKEEHFLRSEKQWSSFSKKHANDSCESMLPRKEYYTRSHLPDETLDVNNFKYTSNTKQIDKNCFNELMLPKNQCYIRSQLWKERFDIINVDVPDIPQQIDKNDSFDSMLQRKKYYTRSHLPDETFDVNNLEYPNTTKQIHKNDFNKLMLPKNLYYTRSQLQKERFDITNVEVPDTPKQIDKNDSFDSMLQRKKYYTRSHLSDETFDVNNLEYPNTTKQIHKNDFNNLMLPKNRCYNTSQLQKERFDTTNVEVPDTPKEIDKNDYFDSMLQRKKYYMRSHLSDETFNVNNLEYPNNTKQIDKNEFNKLMIPKKKYSTRSHSEHTRSSPTEKHDFINVDVPDTSKQVDKNDYCESLLPKKEYYTRSHSSNKTFGNKKVDSEYHNDKYGKPILGRKEYCTRSHSSIKTIDVNSVGYSNDYNNCNNFNIVGDMKHVKAVRWEDPNYNINSTNPYHIFKKKSGMIIKNHAIEKIYKLNNIHYSKPAYDKNQFSAIHVDEINMLLSICPIQNKNKPIIIETKLSNRIKRKCNVLRMKCSLVNVSQELDKPSNCKRKKKNETDQPLSEGLRHPTNKKGFHMCKDICKGINDVCRYCIPNITYFQPEFPRIFLNRLMLSSGNPDNPVHGIHHEFSNRVYKENYVSKHRSSNYDSQKHNQNGEEIAGSFLTMQVKRNKKHVDKIKDKKIYSLRRGKSL